MRVLVGLGNPGARHAYHRHNIGFILIDELAEIYRFPPFRAKFQGQVSEGRIGEMRTILFKPTTYMNESGRAVGALLRFYKLPCEDLCVFHDELDLAPGKVRVKRGGGAGGHNGIRSLDAHIGKDYWRVRVGIGHPGHKERVYGHVLNDFAKSDEAWLDPLVDAIATRTPLLVAGRVADFMSKLAIDLRPAPL